MICFPRTTFSKLRLSYAPPSGSIAVVKSFSLTSTSAVGHPEGTCDGSIVSHTSDSGTAHVRKTGVGSPSCCCCISGRAPVCADLLSSSQQRT